VERGEIANEIKTQKLKGEERKDQDIILRKKEKDREKKRL
jgi:hypothetical protein